MKTILELRSHNLMNIGEIASSIRYLVKQKIDYDVFLPSKNMNLQREFVWNQLQKEQLIYSLFLGRHIPHLAIYVTSDDVYQIIDGKQRLSTIISFINNEFSVCLESEHFFYKDLPTDYQLKITHTSIRHYIYYEEIDNIKMEKSDQDKITWFKFLNFSGTLQDVEHLNKL